MCRRVLAYIVRIVFAMRNVKWNEIFVSCSYNVKNNPWVVHLYTGILSKMDYKNHRFILKDFSGMQENGSCFRDAMQIKDYVFLLPNRQENIPYIICAVNINNNEYVRIELREYSMEDSLRDEMLFAGFCQVDNYLFLIGCSYPAIVRLNIDTFDVDYIMGWRKDIDVRSDDANESVFFVSRQYVIKDNNLYIPFASVPAVLKINIETLQEEIINIDDDHGGYSCVCSLCEDKLLLAGAYEKRKWIYIWNESLGKIENKVYYQDVEAEFSVLNMLQADNGDVYIFPWQNRSDLDLDIYLLGKDEKELSCTNLLQPCEERVWTDEIVHASWKDNNTLLFVTGRDLLWHEYNTKTGEHSKYKVEIDETDENYASIMQQFYESLTYNRIPMFEKDMNLDEFVTII